MSNADTPNRRKSGSQQTEMNAARPLLQAIFLGVVLAAALVAAAVMANPDEMGAPPLPVHQQNSYNQY
ncbi:hypothetical protein [Labrenzia sp. VG12]|uniref:hypothetical protein n=1 Tax=Labrenzia sp. VG12 TaxID=2021862 RepID=UPI000B8C4196|nr:hypothetical protein [Labrenzia sp. VG12]ASP33941.1 hypothetical protein CHH27_12385 [Labrenzia sp. VG12]